MIKVHLGQAVVARTSHGYTTARADIVTPKQVRSQRPHGSYHYLSRADILFAGTKEKAELVVEALEVAQRDRRRACQEAEAAFEIAVAPAAEIRDNAKEAANVAERDAVLKIIEAAS